MASMASLPLTPLMLLIPLTLCLYRSTNGNSEPMTSPSDDTTTIIVQIFWYFFEIFISTSFYHFVIKYPLSYEKEQ